MILRGSTPRSLTRAGLLGLVLVAAVAPPLGVGWAKPPVASPDRPPDPLVPPPGGRGGGRTPAPARGTAALPAPAAPGQAGRPGPAATADRFAEAGRAPCLRRRRSTRCCNPENGPGPPAGQSRPRNPGRNRTPRARRGEEGHPRGRGDRSEAGDERRGGLAQAVGATRAGTDPGQLKAGKEVANLQGQLLIRDAELREAMVRLQQAHRSLKRLTDGAPGRRPTGSPDAGSSGPAPTRPPANMKQVEDKLDRLLKELDDLRRQLRPPPGPDEMVINTRQMRIPFSSSRRAGASAGCSCTPRPTRGGAGSGSRRRNLATATSPSAPPGPAPTG